MGLFGVDYYVNVRFGSKAGIKSRTQIPLQLC